MHFETEAGSSSATHSFDRVGSDRTFRLWLLGITLLALIPCLVLGSSQFIHYDGYWHIFIASQDRWRVFMSEWRGDAHPLLYYLLLGACARIGHSHLIYRSMSILPGAAAVYVLGRAAREMFDRAASALLAAAAFGLSLTMIDLFCDVRGYPLAIFLIVAAFYFLVKLVRGLPSANDHKQLVGCSIFTSLAISTEYYAVFFAGACVLTMALQLVFFPRLRDRLFRLLRDRRTAVALSVFLPCFTCWALYRVHLRYQPTTENNVAEFYWVHGTSLAAFLSRGLQADLNYLSPVQLHLSPAYAIPAFALLALALFIFLGSATVNRALLLGPLLMLATLASEVMVLGAMRRYPFGGYARQQSILFPFVILTLFAAVDRIARLVSPPARGVLFALIGLAIVANFAVGWHRFPKISQELFTDDYRTFRQELPHAGAVYLDQFSLIAYYIHTHAWNWRFAQHTAEQQRIDVYQTTSERGEHIAVLRNLDEWNFNLLKPETYTILAQSLRANGRQRANVFFLKQVVTHPDASTIELERRRISALAREAGLIAAPVVYDNAHAYMTLSLQ